MVEKEWRGAQGEPYVKIATVQQQLKVDSSQLKVDSSQLKVDSLGKLPPCRSCRESRIPVT